MKKQKDARISELLKSSKTPYYLAPMFQVNDLAFREMCRKHGILLCWTGMINSHMWIINPKDRKNLFDTCPADRPLIVQLNGNDEQELLSCARDVESVVDAIDINLGCTQHIARRGQYGYFMVNTPEKREKSLKILARLTSELSLPITTKIRLLDDKDGNPDIKATCEFAKSLEKAGVSLISVHGRHKQLNKSGDIDITSIKEIVNSVTIPVIANGGVRTKEDAELLMKETGAAGVMIGQGLLENPWILETSEPNPVDLAREYLEFYQKYTGDFVVAKRHIFLFFDSIIRSKPSVASHLKQVRSPEEAEKFLQDYSNNKLDDITTQ